LDDLVHGGRPVVRQGRQVDERGSRRQRGHRFQLYTKTVVLVVRIVGVRGASSAVVHGQSRFVGAATAAAAAVITLLPPLRCTHNIIRRCSDNRRSLIPFAPHKTSAVIPARHHEQMLSMNGQRGHDEVPDSEEKVESLWAQYV